MGMKGLTARLERIRHLVTAVTNGDQPGERLAAEAAQAGNRISRRPERLRAETARLRECLRELPETLRRIKATRKGAGQKAVIQRCLNILKAAEEIG